MILTPLDWLFQEQLSQSTTHDPRPHDCADKRIVHHLVCEDQKLMARIEARFYALLDAPSTHKSHFFGGRYENIYPQISALPEIEPLREQLVDYVRQQQGLTAEAASRLRFGFWFNLMQPGHSTTLHTHEDADELLSGVCYLRVPEQSGAIVFQIADEEHRFMPSNGDILLFPPNLLHAVDENRSQQARLSLAFNLGF